MTPQIHELDVVALTDDLPEEHLMRGHVGTVVELLPDLALVEFVDSDGQTYALAPVPLEKLMLLRYTAAHAA